MSEMDIGPVHIGAGLLVLALIILAAKYVYDQQNEKLKEIQFLYLHWPFPINGATRLFKRTMSPPVEDEATLSIGAQGAEQFDPASVKEADVLTPYEKTLKEMDAQESLDENLKALTKKLAEKEGSLQLSKTKIRETQHEIQSLEDMDQDVKNKYRDIMETLKKDLIKNEQDCKKLQEQIEWVAMRRAELKEEVRQGNKMYANAAAELASNLCELQRGRVIEKRELSEQYSDLRNRKDPTMLPSVSFTASPVFTENTLNAQRQSAIDVDA